MTLPASVASPKICAAAAENIPPRLPKRGIPAPRGTYQPPRSTRCFSKGVTAAPAAA